jgi:Flp pilus assembly protein TadG
MEVFRKLVSFARSRGANISIIAAVAAPVVLGCAGLGLEVGYWQVTQRSMQDTADAAVLAAASNAGTSYASEARAVASQYGYANGAGTIAVTASNAASCPGGGATCYSVSVTGLVPLFLTPVVGFQGDARLNGVGMKSITATAVARSTTVSRQYCLLALASSGAEGIHTNGAPNANLSGCNVMSNTSATCNGHNLNADYGDAHTTNSNCGVVQDANVAVVSDPYSSLSSNIPPDPCSTYPQEPAKKQDPALPGSNLWSGTQSITGTKVVCGDLQLSGDTVINAPANGVLVIENGRLDTNGYKLSTASGSAVTVIFSGSNSSSYQHAPTGGGTLDLQAPRNGPWSGVALYQDPKLTQGVDISAAGNSPTWNITGLVYLPHSSVTFSGAVNKSSNGASCFVLVVDNILINGTGSILANGGCASAGLTQPTGTIPGRPVLVL